MLKFVNTKNMYNEDEIKNKSAYHTLSTSDSFLRFETETEVGYVARTWLISLFLRLNIPFSFAYEHFNDRVEALHRRIVSYLVKSSKELSVDTSILSLCFTDDLIANVTSDSNEKLIETYNSECYNLNRIEFIQPTDIKMHRIITSMEKAIDDMEINFYHMLYADINRLVRVSKFQQKIILFSVLLSILSIIISFI